MNAPDDKLTRIGVFYDGNYFFHVSNYYNFCHERRSRISIPGLHQFIRHQVASKENVDVTYCHIVDAHYFRGRLSAAEAEERQKLYFERMFDDVLMRQGIVTHYQPLGPHGEKGVDVWFALEAFEQTIFKRFNVVVLIASDGDYIPLVRKVNSLGTRIMVLGWDFEFTDQRGILRKTVTSYDLLNEVTYPVLMHQIIDDKTRSHDGVVNNIFLPRKEHVQQPTAEPEVAPPGNRIDGNVNAENGPQTGTILNIKNGYGFIKPDMPGDNVFFYWADVENIDYNELFIGDRVRFLLGTNERGECAKEIYASKVEEVDGNRL